MADERITEAKASNDDATSKPTPSAGQRLAAQIAAKAAKKASERGRTPDRLQADALRRAGAWGALLAERRALILGTAGAVIALVVGVASFDSWRTRARREAGAALAEGIEAALAPVGEGLDEDEGVHFASRAARTESVVEKLRGPASEGRGELSAWAALALGNAQLERGEYADARRSYARALDDAGGSPDLAIRALEGVAFTVEGEEKTDEALQRLRELEQRADLGPAAKITALYHVGRIRLAGGARAEGIEKLHEARDALREEGAPSLPYVEEAIARALSPFEGGPAAAPAGIGGMPGPGQLDRATLERLLRDLPNLPSGGAGE